MGVEARMDGGPIGGPMSPAGPETMRPVLLPSAERSTLRYPSIMKLRINPS